MKWAAKSVHNISLCNKIAIVDLRKNKKLVMNADGFD